MSPAQARRSVSFGAETSHRAHEVVAGLPFGMKDSLPYGWDWPRVMGLCTSSVAPEGPEPALVSYVEVDDLLEDGSTKLASPDEPLARGAMLVTSYGTVRRRREGKVVRHRKQRLGLVVSLGDDGQVEVLWSPWLHEELPA